MFSWSQVDSEDELKSDFSLYFSLFFIPEQKYFDVEKQLINSNTQLESETESNKKLKKQVADFGKILIWQIFLCYNCIKIFVFVLSIPFDLGY